MVSSEKYKSKDPAVDEKHGILKNKLGIIGQEELNSVETQCLVEAYKQAATNYSENHAFTDADVRDLHNFFLGKVYEWAGRYRTVDLSSEDIRFCHAAFIQNVSGGVFMHKNRRNENATFFWHNICLL